MVSVTRVHPTQREADMKTDSERGIDQLEARLVVLERWRAAELVRLRHERWMRMAFWIIIIVAYLIYFQGIIPS